MMKFQNPDLSRTENGKDSLHSIFEPEKKSKTTNAISHRSQLLNLNKPSTTQGI